MANWTIKIDTRDLGDAEYEDVEDIVWTRVHSMAQELGDETDILYFITVIDPHGNREGLNGNS